MIFTIKRPSLIFIIIFIFPRAHKEYPFNPNPQSVQHIIWDLMMGIALGKTFHKVWIVGSQNGIWHQRGKVTSTLARCFFILKILVYTQDPVLYNRTLLSKFVPVQWHLLGASLETILWKRKYDKNQCIKYWNQMQCSRPKLFLHGILHFLLHLLFYFFILKKRTLGLRPPPSPANIS